MMKYIPYALGGLLYYVSAARFCAQNDLAGAGIAGVAGTFAILFPIFRRKGGKDEKR